MMEALIGLLGVIVGSVIAIAKETWTAWIEHRRTGSYSAMRAVSTLDEFIESCVDVVSDDGTVHGQYAGRTEHGEEYLVAQVRQPESLEFPEDIDWKSLGGELMYRALALPTALKQANRYIEAQAEHAFPPDYEEVFDARQISYANLGLEALCVTELLREKFQIPVPKRPIGNPDWNARSFFIERIKTNEKRNKGALDDIFSDKGGKQT